LKIEKKILDDRQAELTVEYTAKEFEGFKRRAARKISKDTKIPGFRPGKAPYEVILNRYGEATILQEAIDILLDADYGKFLEQAEIEPSAAGSLDNIESYDPPKMIFTVPLEPEIDLGEYREVRKPYEPEEFDLSKVDDFITNLRRNAATIIPAEHPAEEGNLVYFNLSGHFVDLPEDEDATITDKTPQQVVIPVKGEKSKTEWPFPGFAAKLNGVSADDNKTIQKTYPKNYHDKDYRGKKAIFTVDVQSVKEVELPEFDEEFVQTMGNYDSPEAFRVSVEERMRQDHQEKYDDEYFNDLLNEIAKKTKMVYPPQMVEHEQEHVLEDIKSRLAKQNLDFETYLKLREMDEDKFMEEEVLPAAKERLERSLLVDALISAEELKLDEEMLKDQINLVMGEVFYSGNAEEMQKQMGKEEFSRTISMEGVQRTINAQLQNRLKLIATGQPIPEEGAEPAVEDAEEAAKEEELAEEADTEAATEEAGTPAVAEEVDLDEETLEEEEAAEAESEEAEG